MNILEISNTFGIGGTEKSMQIFCKYLSRDGHNVYVCGFIDGGERYTELKKHARAVLIANGDPNTVINALRKYKIDTLHWHGLPHGDETFNAVCKILQYCKQNHIRVVETAPFSTWGRHDDELLSYIDMKLFVSQVGLLKYMWKFHERIHNKHKFNYIYNPIDTEELGKYKLNRQQRTKLRRTFGIGPDDFVIGKVVRNTLWKWDDRIIDILPELIKKIPKLKVVVRAVPEYKKKLIYRKGLANYFIFLHQSVDEKEVMHTYQIMDVHVHTCRIGESFGVVFGEAMFFGLPIVTDSTDFRQWTLFGRDNAQVEIVRDRVNGFIEMTNEGFVDRIYELYTNKRLYKDISQRNQKDVKKIYDAHVLVKRLELFLEGKENILHEKVMTMREYIHLAKQQDLLGLFKTNIKALYEKFYC